MPSSAPATTKDEWRTQFRACRRDLAPASYAARSALIATRALALPTLATANVVHVYWPLAERGEVDTRLLISGLRARNVEIVLPVVTSFDAAAPTLEHRRYAGPDRLTTNRWGIREPTDTEVVSPDEFDAVVVPALGVGKNGHRIGHGTGYYDSFLQSLPVPRIGLVYEECLIPTVPADPHDVPVTTVVTEKRVLRVPQR